MGKGHFSFDLVEGDDQVVLRVVFKSVDGKDIDVASRSDVHMLVSLNSYPKSGAFVFCVPSQFLDVKHLAFRHGPISHELFVDVPAIFNFF